MAHIGNINVPIYTRFNDQEYELGSLDVGVHSTMVCGQPELSLDTRGFAAALESAIPEPTLTERLLDGQKVTLVHDRPLKTFDIIGKTAEELTNAGHAVRVTRQALALPNGGELRALQPIEARGTTADHVIILGCIDEADAEPIIAESGTVSHM